MNAASPVRPSAAGACELNPDRLRQSIAAISIIVLLAIVLLRMTGPSDLYDQTQPKTVSYTTDMLVHGGTHWILPIERGELPATKPPLYNWMASPWVKLLGFHSEIAHKLPSVIAMLACWVIIVRLGNGIDRNHRMLGWLAAMCMVCNYAIFKLGYLARPDMLLTMWMFIAWVCATSIILRFAHSESETPADSKPSLIRLAVLFWLAIALALLTKGPVALMPLLAAMVDARVLTGRFRTVSTLMSLAGLLAVMLVFGAWVWAVWRIDPNHLHDELWFNEVYGRLTGTGEEGTRGGTRSLLKELHYQPLYFLSRFGPWSLLSIAAIAALVFAQRQRNTLPPRQLRWLTITGSGCVERNWMISAAIFVVLTVVIFSLSVGKRADYVAIAIPQASLLAGWALLRLQLPSAMRRRRAVLTAAAMTIAALTYYDHRQVWAPQRGFGDAIRQFIHESTDAIASQPARVLNCSAGQTHLQAMLGIADADQRRLVAETIARGDAFWVVAGRTQNPPHEFDLWMQQRRFRANADEVVRSAELPRAEGWPEQVTLWRITPVDQD